jgi:hypothetical protein
VVADRRTIAADVLDDPSGAVTAQHAVFQRRACGIETSLEIAVVADAAPSFAGWSWSTRAEPHAG